MFSILVDDAIKFVRRNIDEQEQNDSDMMAVEDNDSTAFEELCKTLLPEAINDIHLSAPIELLDGIQINKSEDLSDVAISEDTLTFKLNKSFLRLVAFKASDSTITLSRVVNEVSNEGRMQLNPYTRGTFDNPCLVLKQGNSESENKFAYYSLQTDFEDPNDAIERMEYLPKYRYVFGEDVDQYEVAGKIANNIIDQLTAKVLMVYNQAEKANFFFTIAGFGDNDKQKEK